MNESTDETDAALVADLSEVKKTEGQARESTEGDGACEGPSKKRKLKQQKGGKSSGEASEARRESHKLIEQKRRQKINDKINELRELLNYPDGSQNKAVVLSAAVENIKNLKVVCGKLLASHRQLQEEYLQILSENERLRKNGEAMDTAKYAQFAQQMLEKEHKRGGKQGMVSQSNFPPAMDYRLPDLNMSFLYDEPAPQPRGFQHSVNYQPQLGRDSLGLRDGMQRDGILRDGVSMRDGISRETLPQSGSFQGLLGGGGPFGDQQVNQETETSRQALNRLLYHHDQESTART